MEKITGGVVHHFIRTTPQNTYYLKDLLWVPTAAYEEKMQSEGWELFEKDKSGGYLWKRDGDGDTFQSYPQLREKQDRTRNLFTYSVFFLISLLAAIFVSAEPFFPLFMMKVVSTIATVIFGLLVLVQSIRYFTFRGRQPQL